ncbi:MAG TPA: DUF4350 domain-containing protein [Burkholderiales bacterium]|nr:DUF4350 domain-containing protein [Burkholderiales bacterium]
MSDRFIGIAIALVAAGAAVIGFLVGFDRVTERVWVGYRGEALRNPFLAAERLIQRMGGTTRHATTPADLSEAGPHDTVVLAAPRHALGPADRERLLAWTGAGGHLVVEAAQRRMPDPLLDALGVARVAPPPKAPRPLLVDVGGGAVRADMGCCTRLSAQGTEGAPLVRFALGAGRVTVVADLGFARNASIGEHEHAELAWRLVQRPGGGAGAVLVFDDPSGLSLVAWLAQNAWPALAGCGLLLALGLWHAAPRFGPVAPDPEPARRRLLDHLRASGRFLWSAGSAPQLFESAREAALRRLMRAQPEFAGAAREEREHRLAERFGILPADAAWVLEPARECTPRALVAATDVYRAIHEQLAHGIKTNQGKEK